MFSSVGKAITLAIVQGLTEFLPISSSAHLRLLRHLFGWEQDPFFDLVCHLGTICALVFFLRKPLNKTIKDPQRLFLIFLAILPLLPFYFFLKPFLAKFSEIHFIGFFLIITSFFLFFISSSPFSLKNEKTLEKNKSLEKEEKLEKGEKKGDSLMGKIKDVLWIGTMQGLALFPGISRSASTISAARFFGWSVDDAIHFSFFLAIPTILGGFFLEGRHYLFKGALTQSILIYFIGFFLSLFVGLISVRLLFTIFKKKKVHLIAWYCLCLGGLTGIWLNLL